VPIFEYVCAACDHRFSLLVFGGEKALCPSCGSDRVEKQFSSFGVKGSSPARTSSSCGHGGGL